MAWKAPTVCPLFKGGDQADPNCYRPISSFALLIKNVGKTDCKLGMQSGFCAGYGCVTATLKMSSMMSPLPLILSNLLLLFLLTLDKSQSF